MCDIMFVFQAIPGKWWRHLLASVGVFFYLVIVMLYVSACMHICVCHLPLPPSLSPSMCPSPHYLYLSLWLSLPLTHPPLTPTTPTQAFYPLLGWLWRRVPYRTRSSWSPSKFWLHTHSDIHMPCNHYSWCMHDSGVNELTVHDNETIIIIL